MALLVLGSHEVRQQQYPVSPWSCCLLCYIATTASPSYCKPLAALAAPSKNPASYSLLCYIATTASPSYCKPLAALAAPAKKPASYCLSCFVPLNGTTQRPTWTLCPCHQQPFLNPKPLLLTHPTTASWLGPAFQLAPPPLSLCSQPLLATPPRPHTHHFDCAPLPPCLLPPPPLLLLNSWLAARHPTPSKPPCLLPPAPCYPHNNMALPETTTPAELGNKFCNTRA